MTKTKKSERWVPPSDLGQRLRERRGQLNLTQEQVAARLGFSVKTIKHLETGAHKPHRHTTQVVLYWLDARQLAELTRLVAHSLILGSTEAEILQAVVRGLGRGLEQLTPTGPGIGAQVVYLRCDQCGQFQQATLRLPQGWIYKGLPVAGFLCPCGQPQEVTTAPQEVTHAA